MTEKVEFKANISDLNAALNNAGLVKPAIDPKGQSGYLMVAKKDNCHVYSSDETQKSRVSFLVTELTNGGSFVLPSKAVSPLSCLSGTEISLTSVVQDGVHVVQYETEARSASQRIPTVDPRTIQSLDRDLEASKEVATFPSNILKEALIQTKSYLGDFKDSATPETRKNINLLGSGKGDGFAFCSSGSRVCYFHSDALLGKRLKIHGMHVGLLINFLGTVGDTVTMRKSETSTYFTNSDMSKVVGWSDGSDAMPDFKVYGFDNDTHVLRISKAEFMSSLQYIRKSLDSKLDRIRFCYNSSKQLIELKASDNGIETSAPLVAVRPISSEDSTDTVTVVGGSLSRTADVQCNFNVNFLMDLVSPVKGAEVELRIAPFPDKEDQYLLRVSEDFEMDGSACRVIRCSPSRV